MRLKPARPFRRTLRQSSGQALVEFALAAPIMFVLLIGLVEGGRYVFYSESLNHAAREGARYAIIHGENSDDPTGPPDDPSAGDVKLAVRAAAAGFGDGAGLVIPDPVYSPEINRRASAVTVTLRYTYTPIVPIFGAVTVEAESTLVINN